MKKFTTKPKLKSLLVDAVLDNEYHIALRSQFDPSFGLLNTYHRPPYLNFENFRQSRYGNDER